MDAPPLDDEGFASLMAALGPFEPRPRLAVGLSGGSDSLALCLLADRWARARGGTVAALTVDHRLRRESTQEAATVGQWLQAHGIEHTVLPWLGEKPGTGIQAAARAARYRLLVEACRERGILHLLLAHHREDQAETVLQRLASGSGIDGLAAMAPVQAKGGVRLLRPLLTVPKARLRATLQQQGQMWIEDPANRDPVFARARLRASAGVLAREGLNAPRLGRLASRMARASASLEREAARVAAGRATIYPWGGVRLARSVFADCDEEIGLRLLTRALMTVGGLGLPPRGDRLERLHRALVDAARLGEERGQGALRKGFTLGGCRIIAEAASWLIVRESAAVAGPVTVDAGGSVLWDGRFRITIADDAPGPFVVARLGRDGWCELGERLGLRERASRARGIAPAARVTLPALRCLDALVAVPHLNYVSRPWQNGNGEDDGGLAVARSGIVASMVFAPERPLVADSAFMTANGHYIV